jgi:hypothetical protein
MPRTAQAWSSHLATLETNAALLVTRPRHPQLIPNSYSVTPLSFNYVRNSSALATARTPHTRSFRRRKSRGGEGVIRTRCGFSRAEIIQHRASLSFLLSRIPFLILRANAIAFLSPNRILFSLGRISRVARAANKILPGIQTRCRQRRFLSFSANVAILSERYAVGVLRYAPSFVIH